MVAWAGRRTALLSVLEAARETFAEGGRSEAKSQCAGPPGEPSSHCCAGMHTKLTHQPHPAPTHLVHNGAHHVVLDRTWAAACVSSTDRTPAQAGRAMARRTRRPQQTRACRAAGLAHQPWAEPTAGHHRNVSVLQREGAGMGQPAGPKGLAQAVLGVKASFCWVQRKQLPTSAPHLGVIEDGLAPPGAQSVARQRHERVAVAVHAAAAADGAVEQPPGPGRPAVARTCGG